MGPYFHARWYIDALGLLQRRTPAEQQRIEDEQWAAEDLAEGKRVWGPQYGDDQWCDPCIARAAIAAPVAQASGTEA